MPSGGRLHVLVDTSEKAKIEAWRYECLLRAGCPDPLADRLSISDVDLHVACEMLAQGCSPETLEEILT